MKSLGKLKINSAKMLNNEELINLKGGYGSSGCGDAHGTCDTTQSCTITLDGKTYDGTCGYVLTLCGCIQN